MNKIQHENYYVVTLYKRRADKGVQVWTIHRDYNAYRTVSGQHHGEMVESAWTYCEGKNHGKANETSDDEQCNKDVQSIITKKLNAGGYHDDINNIDRPKFIKPMLAKVADLDRIEKELASRRVFIQPKLDGIRCIATKHSLMSRSGKEIVSCQHIRDALAPYFDKNPSAILDGELYNHDLRDDFNEIVSAVRKTKTLDPEQAKKVQYHIYDQITDLGWNFSDRWDNLQTDTPGLNSDAIVQLVTTPVVTHIGNVTAAAAVYLELGYEGTMIRYNAPYQLGKRNWNLQKLKKFTDEEFIVTGFMEGKGNAEGLAVKCIIETNDQVTVYPTMMGTVEYRTYVYENQEEFIGKTATIKHFGYTKDGSLRHPNCKRIHTDSARDDH